MSDPVAHTSGSQATIGPYEIINVLHRGPMATIYAGVAPDTRRELALKVVADVEGNSFNPHSPAHHLVHRHIVQVFDQGADGDLSYIVMERLRGRTLRQRLTDPQFGDAPAMRADIVAQFCIGLHAAHRQGVVHGRVTPDNVFVTDDGIVKILNFVRLSASGATLVSDGSTSSGFEYSAPEQLLGRENIDGRADVFAAGVILYEIVTGRHPFQGASMTATLSRIVREPHAPLEGMQALDDILRRALEKNPEQRMPSAQELAHALWSLFLSPDAALVEEAAPAETVYVEPEPEPSAAAPSPASWLSSITSSRETKIAVGVGAGALVLAAGALLYMC